jgi:hypothetical protein
MLCAIDISNVLARELITIYSATGVAGPLMSLKKDTSTEACGAVSATTSILIE